MSKALKVDLAPEAADTVRAAVASGEYRSPAEVVTEALDVWLRAKYPVLRDVEALRAHLAAAEASPIVEAFDVEQLIADAKARRDA